MSTFLERGRGASGIHEAETLWEECKPATGDMALF